MIQQPRILKLDGTFYLVQATLSKGRVVALSKYELVDSMSQSRGAFLEVLRSLVDEAEDLGDLGIDDLPQALKDALTPEE